MMVRPHGDARQPMGPWQEGHGHRACHAHTQGPLEESLQLPLTEPEYRRFAADVCELCGLADHATADCANCVCRSCLRYGHWGLPSTHRHRERTLPAILGNDK